MRWNNNTTTTIQPSVAYWKVGSWESYWRTLQHHREPGQIQGDFGAYLPDPDEIDARIITMKWLVSQGFPDSLITKIMVDDTPPLTVVQRLVARHGAAEAMQILKKGNYGG